MNKFIVCTTINPPTDALRKFAQMEDWELVLVLDKKTPVDAYSFDMVFADSILLHPHELECIYPELSRMLGWNNVDIRNLGFLWAYQNGADIVAMVDDDNVPWDNWGQEIYIGKKLGEDVLVADFIKHFLCENTAVFDPLSVFRYPNGFYPHRGYPIHLIPRRYNHSRQFEPGPLQFDIQANLWNVEMDYDAMFKLMEYGAPVATRCYRRDWYTSYQSSPFNMQNTLITRRALKYCPSIPYTGRMCDIWGAYYCQAMGYKVLYGPPTVDHVQPERSRLSLIKDMEEEMLGYRHSHIVEDMAEVGPDRVLRSILPNISYEFVKAYEESFK